MKVITLCHSIPAEPYYCHREFFEALARFNCEPTVLGAGQPYPGMMSRLKLSLPYMKTITDEIVIITDCWDVLFLASPEAIVSKFMEFNRAIVFSAERTLFPPGDYGNYPDGLTDSCYLNCGWMVGYRKALIDLFEHMKVMDVPDDFHGEDGRWTHFLDQEYLHHAFVEQFVPMTLDYESVLCQSMYRTYRGEIDISSSRMHNMTHGTYPMVVHWNGPAKTEAEITLRQGVEWWRNRCAP